MPLSVQNGKLVVKSGSLGTQQGCCCQQIPCTCFNSTAYAIGECATFGGGDVYITVEGTCFGTGAEGKADDLGTVNPCNAAAVAGGIGSITITNAGSGYAKLGRVAPTITTSAAGGSDADFTTDLTKLTEACSVPYWAVANVTVNDGGAGYADDCAVTFTAATGDTTQTAALARGFVVIDDPQPTVSIASTSGAGAVLEPTWELRPSGDWATFPDIVRGAICEGPPKKTYRLSGFTITNGGSGYEQFDVITLTFATASEGVEMIAAYADVDTVDGSGAITGLFVGNPVGFTPGPFGKYIGSESGVLEVVKRYAIVSGSTVCNTTTGVYYREDSSKSPYVSPLTVTIEQDPETGSGAVITATVDDDTSSGTFGQIIAIKATTPGVQYLDSVCCELPDNVYVTFGSTTLEVPFTGEEVSSTSACDDAEIVDVGDTASTGSFTAKVIGCTCDAEMHVVVTWTGQCLKGVLQGGVVISQLVYQSTTTSCWRFPKDETGCPDTDAVLVSSSGTFECFDGPIEDCPCGNTTCFDFGLPTVSLTP